MSAASPPARDPLSLANFLINLLAPGSGVSAHQVLDPRDVEDLRQRGHVFEDGPADPERARMLYPSPPHDREQ